MSEDDDDPPATAKRVRFTSGTHVMEEDDHIALTITRHNFIEDKGHTQYFIKLLCRGVEWTLHKRYKDFHSLHVTLMRENSAYGVTLPKLPEKRWFERQRWLNSSDENYCWDRRRKLQAYLRALVKVREFRNESLAFWIFICMPKRAMVNEVEDERDGHQPGLPEDLQTQREDGASRNLVQKHSSDDLTALVESVGDSDTMETEISEEESQMRHQLSWSGQQFGLLRSGTEGDESGESRESIKAASRVKLNRIFDDNGNEIFLPIGILKSDGSPLDLGRVASDNALLNSRIKSKDQPTNAHLVGLVNSPSFDNFEESLRHSDFDENFHFTGPRTSSGTTSPPHSRLGSPTASYTSENTIFSLGLGWSPERAAVPIEGKIIKGPDQSATTKIAHDGCLPDEKIADRSTRYKLPQPLPEY